MILPGMRNYLWQAGRFLSPGQRRIFPELRPFFGRKLQKYWNFHPSVLSLWRIRADCTRPFLISAAMTGWYLQVLQAWEVFFRQMEKKKIDLRSLGNAKIAVIGEGTKKKFLERGIYPDFMPLFMMEIPLGKELGALFKMEQKRFYSKSLPWNKDGRRTENRCTGG